MKKIYVRYSRVNRNGTTVPVTKVFHKLGKAIAFRDKVHGIILFNQ